MKRFELIFAWYDIWVGIFVDTKKKKIYFFPVPMFGLIINYGKKCRYCRKTVCPKNCLSHQEYFKTMIKLNDKAIRSVIRAAMKATQKDVIKPKCVRDGRVK